MKPFSLLGLTWVLGLASCLVAGGWTSVVLLTPANWNVLYDGYGNVTWNTNDTVTFQPQTTSAVLILSQVQARDFTLSITATTIRQLLTSPEAWEVFWVMFNYDQIGGPESTNKTTNYFILKTSGCELGTASMSVAQTFLNTSDSPTLTLGVAYQYTIVKSGKQVTTSVDGNVVFTGTYADLYDQTGHIGLYCEDSEVYVSSVNFTPAAGSNQPSSARRNLSWLAIMMGEAMSW